MKTARQLRDDIAVLSRVVALARDALDEWRYGPDDSATRTAMRYLAEALDELPTPLVVRDGIVQVKPVGAIDRAIAALDTGTDLPSVEGRRWGVYNESRSTWTDFGPYSAEVAVRKADSWGAGYRARVLQGGGSTIGEVRMTPEGQDFYVCLNDAGDCICVHTKPANLPHLRTSWPVIHVIPAARETAALARVAELDLIVETYRESLTAAESRIAELEADANGLHAEAASFIGTIAKLRAERATPASVASGVEETASDPLGQLLDRLKAKQAQLPDVRFSIDEIRAILADDEPGTSSAPREADLVRKLTSLCEGRSEVEHAPTAAFVINQLRMVLESSAPREAGEAKYGVWCIDDELPGGGRWAHLGPMTWGQALTKAGDYFRRQHRLQYQAKELPAPPLPPSSPEPEGTRPWVTREELERWSVEDEAAEAGSPAAVVSPTEAQHSGHTTTCPACHPPAPPAPVPATGERWGVWAMPLAGNSEPARWVYDGHKRDAAFTKKEARYWASFHDSGKRWTYEARPLPSDGAAKGGGE